MPSQVAFAGPDATKWTYMVVPFGPVIVPQMFLTFIHGMNSTWKVLVKSKGVSIGDDTNKRVDDDILSWAGGLETALLYMECQWHIYYLKTYS